MNFGPDLDLFTRYIFVFNINLTMVPKKILLTDISLYLDIKELFSYLGTVVVVVVVIASKVYASSIKTTFCYDRKGTYY